MNIWKFKKRNIKISTLNVWNSRMWLNKIEERINSNIKLIKSSKSIKIETFCAESPLPILLLNNKKKSEF